MTQCSLSHMFPMVSSPYETIQSGDLYLSRCEETLADTPRIVVTGSHWTHVGIFFRDPDTNKLYVMEKGDPGIILLPIETKVKTYRGDLHVRCLRKKLNNLQLNELYNIIEQCFQMNPFEKMNDRGIHVRGYGSTSVLFQYHDSANLTTTYNSDYYKAIFSTFCNCATPMQSTTPTALCTDLVFMIMKRLKLVPENFKTNCIKPNWFVYSPIANSVYSEIYTIKLYERDKIVEAFNPAVYYVA